MIFQQFNTLFDEVLPEVAGVPQALALNAIRNSAIEFCEKSRVWTADADPISAVGNTAIYDFEPEAGTEVIGVMQAWFNGEKITPATRAQIETLDATGIPLHYVFEQPDSFTLAPIPVEAATNAIEMSVILRPTRAATGMEKWIINKYFLQIAAGAKSALFAMPGKPWSAPDLSAYYRNIFQAGIDVAAVIPGHTHELPEMFTAPSPI